MARHKATSSSMYYTWSFLDEDEFTCHIDYQRLRTTFKVFSLMHLITGEIAQQKTERYEVLQVVDRMVTAFESVCISALSNFGM